MPDEHRTELEARAFAAWTPAEPPPGFADRVLVALADEAPKASANPDVVVLASRFPWPRLAVAAAVVAATVVSGVAYKLWPSTPTATEQSTKTTTSKRVPGATTAVTPATGHTPVDSLPADFSDQVDAYLDSIGRRYGDAFKFQGSVLVARHGEPLYVRHFGPADRTTDQPIASDTRFKIGSLTQQFIAVATLQLRDAGKLSLDDAVSRYVPSFPHAAVSIRHLLTHSAGIPNYTDLLASSNLVPGTRYAPEFVLKLFREAPLDFPPGTEFAPSNSNYFLLGLVLEAAAKKPLAEVLQAGIFSPAGMVHTSLGVPDDPSATMAVGYEFSEDEILVPVAAYDLSVYGGASGLVSSPDDLLRWDRALAKPGLLLSQASLDEMMAPVVQSYGLGWIVVREHGQTMVGHPGGVDGFNAAVARYLGDGISVIALANTVAIDCRDVIDAVASIAHHRRVSPREEHVEVPLAPAMFGRYLGIFHLTPATRTALLTQRIDAGDLSRMEMVQIYDNNGRLFMLVPDHGAKWLHNMGEDRFFFKDHAGTVAQFGPPGAPVETLSLQEGPDGLVFQFAKAHPDSPPQAIVLPAP